MLEQWNSRFPIPVPSDLINVLLILYRYQNFFKKCTMVIERTYLATRTILNIKLVLRVLSCESYMTKNMIVYNDDDLMTLR